jgi:hypothetical protein
MSHVVRFGGILICGYFALFEDSLWLRPEATPGAFEDQ